MKSFQNIDTIAWEHVDCSCGRDTWQVSRLWSPLIRRAWPGLVANLVGGQTSGATGCSLIKCVDVPAKEFEWIIIRMTPPFYLTVPASGHKWTGLMRDLPGADWWHFFTFDREQYILLSESHGPHGLVLPTRPGLCSEHTQSLHYLWLTGLPVNCNSHSARLQFPKLIVLPNLCPTRWMCVKEQQTTKHLQHISLKCVFLLYFIGILWLW